MQGDRLELEDGAVIFSEGDDSDQAFIIEEGRVRIVKQIAGAPQELAKLEAGELFGEMGVIDGNPRSATATSAGRCVLTAIRGDHFLRRINKDPAFASSVMGKLVERLRHTTRLVESANAEDHAETAKVKRPEKFDGDTWERRPDDQDRKAAPGLAEPKGIAADAPPKVQQDDDTAQTAGHGPQRTLPPGFNTEGQTATQEAPVGKDARASASGPTAKTDTASTDEAPLRFFLPPASNGEVEDTNDVLLGLIEGLFPTEAIRPKSPKADITGSEFSAPLGGVFEVIRKAAMDKRLTLSVITRPDGASLRIRFLAPWPDDEARLGGFSALDELIVPRDGEDRLKQEVLAAAIIAASQTHAPDALRRLQRFLPPDFASAKQQQSILMEGLEADDLARQYSLLGCIFARAAMVTGKDARFRDSLLAYETAYAALNSGGSDRLRGLVLLHMGILLHTMADRRKDRHDAKRAADCCREAAGYFDPTETPYQFVTAWARLGAIQYRAALDSGDIEDCKQGLQAFRTALEACDRKRMAEPWADVMNGLGQLLILMGKLSKNTEFITWAVQVCGNATEVRSKETNPTGWARTVSNLGTALYLLAKATNDEKGFARAIDRFVAAEDIFSVHRIPGMAETCKRNRLLVENYRDKFQSKGAAPCDWWTEEG